MGFEYYIRNLFFMSEKEKNPENKEVQLKVFATDKESSLHNMECGSLDTDGKTYLKVLISPLLSFLLYSTSIFLTLGIRIKHATMFGRARSP